MSPAGRFREIGSPVGLLRLVGDGEALTHIRFLAVAPASEPDARLDRGAFGEAVRQLEAYFGRELRAFDLPLAPSGTAFQRKVWNALREIPWGATVSYGELAARIGQPRAVRAVGAANGRNPIPIVVPCHRVIGSNGTLTGFGGGLPAKRTLLELEGSSITSARGCRGGSGSAGDTSRGCPRTRPGCVPTSPRER